MADREEIALRQSLVELDLDGHQGAGGVARSRCRRQVDDVEDRGRADPPRLVAEPAPAGEVARQHPVQRRPAVSLQRVGPAAGAADRLASRLGLAALLEGEPVEAVPAESDEVRQVADLGELGAAEQLDRYRAAVLRQVELGRLGEAGEVDDDEDGLLAVPAKEGEHLSVLGEQHLEGAAGEGLVAVAQRDEAPHPPQQRARVLLLRRDVDRLGVVLGVDDDRQVQPLRVRGREAGVAVGVPLHRGANAVAVAEVDVVAHPDLVAVVDDRGTRQREQESVHHLDEPPVVAEQRSQPAPDADVDAGLRILGVHLVHVVAFLVGHHLERQLVVVAQEQPPLAVRRYRGSLVEDVDDREPVLLAGRHEDAWHQREVKGHLAGLAAGEVLHRVLGPLVRLGEQHPVGEPRVDVTAQVLEKGVGLGEVLAGRALAGVQVRNRVEPQPVDAHLEPVVDHVVHRLPDVRAVVVQARLVGIEAVPVVRLRHRVERPVRRLEVLEDDARVAVAVRGLTPRVEVAVRAPGRRHPGPLEPRVLVGGVGEHELGDDLDPPRVRTAQHRAEVAQGAVGLVHLAVVGDVVAVVAQRRGVERQQPQRGDAELLEVVELAEQAAEVPDAVAVAVGEGAHVHLVDDGVLVPERGLGVGSDGLRNTHVAIAPVAGSMRKMWAGVTSGSSITKLCEPLQR
jgi:hypothetical protein